MGWSNPPIPWSELERKLSDRRRPGGAPPSGDGGDSPAWSHKRQPYTPAAPVPSPAGPITAYAELHAHSNFSFLDGASSPEQLLEEAARLGLTALALTDHDGLYGIVRLAETAESYPRIATVFGAELSLELGGPQNGIADPEGSHLVVLARREEGYHRLASALTHAQLAGGEKGRPVYDLEELARQADGHWVILSGCRKGAVRRALAAGGPDAAARELHRLVRLFGEANVYVELFDHGHPLDGSTNDALALLAAEAGLPVIATGSVHYASPAEHRLASALAAVRARRSLDEMDGWLPASGGAHLRSGAEMAARFERFPGAVDNTVPLAEELAFSLRRARPRLPRQDVPEGHTPMSWLRKLVWEGAERKYPGYNTSVRKRIEKELAVIEAKDFPGYFLIVHDIVQFARGRGILCQGRGSAANSAVCFLLGITAVDSIFYRLPFERFLSSLRDEEPDIDVDFDSDRREEVIQYVYRRYGRLNAAQVANVVTYRPKFAVRDMAKALGYSTGQQDAWSKQVERWGGTVASADHDIPQPVVQLAEQVLTFPRHLGIHSGGMVLTDRPVGEVCPIEHARMEDRTVLQWDKDDCAWMGLVKFDLLGLGMLAALQYTFDLVGEHLGENWSLEGIPREERGVYDMLCRADSIGVFQVESRAQMGTLPRLQPRRFYDLVVEIALIRPGPIQGGAVHPYIRRKLGREEVTYLHPKLEPVLERTLGVPLFQEQLMQMAMAVGGCTGEDADLLRRAMGSKRGIEKISSLKARLYAGMESNGITGEVADSIYEKIEAFANFGFAESHSISFALLVYASSWLKLHYPAAFLAALLRAQPMGFYSPQSLVADARRHGVRVLRPCILRSGADARLEPIEGAPAGGGQARCLAPEQPPVGEFDRSVPPDWAEHRRDGAFAVRLGLAEVSSIGHALAERIVAERDSYGAYRSMADVARRVGLTTEQLEALAAAGAFAGLGLERREALWSAGEASQDKADYLPGSVVSVQPPLLPMLTPAEQVVYDLWATGISTDDHPIRHARDQLRSRGALRIDELQTHESGRRISVGGVVTHRQRPATAGGVTFINLEDETGTLNVIAGIGVWNRYRRVARESPAMVIRGILERSPEGVTNLIADKFEPLTVAAQTTSRDFRELGWSRQARPPISANVDRVMDDRYSNDVLSPGWRDAGRKVIPSREATRDLVVEEVATGFCGAVIRIEKKIVTLEDRHGKLRLFPLGGGFLVDGEPVVLVVPSARQPTTRARTASGSMAVKDAPARVARASRIFVEGRHDAELVEKVWGADLRIEGVVVEFIEGVDNLEELLKEFRPGPGRKVGVLVDHLVAGSKESRIAEAVARGPYGRSVLVVGHPYVDVWQSVKPGRLGLTAWPQVPRTVEWKHGICVHLGWPHDDQADIARAWQRILGQVRSFADLEPQLLGRVEQLIDFVTVDQG